jgi:hypothetical protein
MEPNLVDFSDKIIQFKKEHNSVKDAFMKLIKNKKIPLEDRWNYWCDAPSFLKDFSQTSVKFAVLGKHFHWNYDMGYVRYQTIETEDLIDELQISVFNQCLETDLAFHCRLFRNQQLLDELKEEILARNLEYFIYNW